MNFNELANKAHSNAVKHGFWEKRLSNEHCLMLVITEIGELVEADRSNKRRAKVDWFNKKMKTSIICRGLDPNISKERGYEVAYNETIKGSIEEEFADIAIRLFDLAGALGIDFDKMNPCRYYRAFDKFSFTENAFALCKGLSRDVIGIEKRIQFGIEYVKKWAESLNVDLTWHIEQKMKYNENRPIMHDKKY
ncbi:MAG: dUTPase [Bacteriophage sp.]|jgi:NTP pyrophosphatase (non-canonical NTP hydrolase)|nr:MAG: dUTPase [Bacteriophage sp.]